MTITTTRPDTGQQHEVPARTYGNWRKPSSPGLPGLGLLGTVAFLGGVVLAVLIELIGGLIAGAVALGLVVLVVAPIAVRNKSGRNGWQQAIRTIAWRRGTGKGQHLYRSGVAGPVAYGRHTLPGLLARSTLLEAVDALGQPFALLHVPATRHYSVLLAADPEGGTLVDADTTDAWVAKWGQWLSDLPREPNLVAASATVETAADPGNRLTTEIDRLLEPDAPALAAAMLNEVRASYALASPSVTGWVALTYTATRAGHGERELLRRRKGNARAKRRSTVLSAAEVATQIGSRLPTLIRELAGTGAGGAGRALTVDQVAALVRTAYDPDAAEDLDRRRAAGEPADLTWEDAGPVAALESWDALRHDGGASITWQMVQAPRGLVQSSVLAALLEPTTALTRKRVTVLFRPHDPGAAARLADADVRTAIGRAGARKGEARAADSLELSAARQTAAEEASGAGLTRFSMLVTATVTDPDELDHAADVIDQAAAGSRLKLRRAYGAQSAAFAAALGVGLVLNSHVMTPDALRTYL